MRVSLLNLRTFVCSDGSDSRDKPKLYRLQHSITEVGSDCTDDGAIQVTSETPQQTKLTFMNWIILAVSKDHKTILASFYCHCMVLLNCV